MTDSPSNPLSTKGFSLLELSIVLVIIALLASGLLLSLSASQEASNRKETDLLLANAREALLGFAVAQGRLPCPAAPNTTGLESPLAGMHCTHPWQGLLPAISLGLHPVNDAGYAIDAWGNPLRYAITTFTQANCDMAPCVTTPNGLRNVWNSAIPPAPDLRVCNSAIDISGSAGSADCGSGRALTKDAMAIVFSPGKNANLGSTNPDEIANENNDRLFVSHNQTLLPTPFDDQVSWISSNVLYSRMIAAGRLP